ncbi:MAG: hypothetical protein AAF909_14820 [Pseudomonadota bacterium]
MDFIQEPFDDWFHRTTDELSRRAQRDTDNHEAPGAQEGGADAAPADGPIRPRRAEPTRPRASVPVSAPKPRTRAKIDRLLRAVAAHPRELAAREDHIGG